MKDRSRIFISYRREGGAELARLIREQLQKRRYVIFMDVEDLRSGPFNTALLREIEAATDVIVVLSPHSLDRCADEDDWLRLEVSHAIRSGRNIVPVMTRGFKPPDMPLPDEMAPLLRFQGIAASHEYFEASVEKLTALLVGKPRPRFSGALLAGVSVILAALAAWAVPNGTEEKTSSPDDDLSAASAPTTSATDTEPLPAESAVSPEVLDSRAATPDGNYAIGRDLCFVRDEWSTGMPFLAEGSREKIRSAALKELARPASPRDQLDVGLEWRAAAIASAEPDNWHCNRRARYWFAKVLDDPANAADATLRGDAARHLLAVPALQVELKIHTRTFSNETILIARNKIEWRSEGGSGPNSIANAITGEMLPAFTSTYKYVDFHSFDLNQVRTILPEGVDLTTAKLYVKGRDGKTAGQSRGMVVPDRSDASKVVIRVLEWDSKKRKPAIYQGAFEMDLTLTFGK
jgi:hypothetical protein